MYNHIGFDEKIIEIRIPKCRIFKLVDGEVNKEYETLLKNIEDGKWIRVSSSGTWTSDGKAYMVQVHYYEVEKKKVKRDDVDYADTDENKEPDNNDKKEVKRPDFTKSVVFEGIENN